MPAAEPPETSHRQPNGQYEQNGMPQFVVRYMKRGVEAGWMYDSSDSIPTFGGEPHE